MTAIGSEIADAQSALRRVALGSLVSHVGAGISRAFFDEPTGIPVLRSNNVKDGNVVLDGLKYWHRIDPTGANLAKVKPHVGDLLINFVNGSQRELGKAAVFRGELPDCIVSTNFFIVRVNVHEVLPDYLNYFLQSQEYRRWLFRTCGFSGQGSFNQEQLRSLTVPVSPISHQKRVVTALGVLDAMRYSLKRLIDAKRILKRGLMQQLLTGQKRFCEFHNHPWHASRLGDHVTVVTRRNLNGQTLVLTASGQHGLVDQRRYFNRSVAGADLTKYHLLKKGEFAYNRSAMNGYPYGATKRLDEHEEGVLSTLYLCFEISDARLDSDYLKHVLESGVLNRQLRPIVRVGARAHGLLNISDDDFLSVSIPFPDLEEQRRIAGVLSLLDQEIELLTVQRAKTEDYKRGLLSKLLSGEIPVPA